MWDSLRRPREVLLILTAAAAMALLTVQLVPGTRARLLAVEEILGFCGCNQRMAQLAEGDAAPRVVELAGERLRVVAADGLLRPPAETTWGAEPARWGAGRLFVDCRRPDDTHRRSGVVRSWTVRLSADGRVRSVEHELRGWLDCAVEDLAAR